MQVRSQGWEDALKEDMAINSSESHGERSLAGHDPQDRKESDTILATARIHTLLIFHPQRFSNPALVKITYDFQVDKSHASSQPFS